MYRADKIIALVLLVLLAGAYYVTLGFPERVATYPKALILISSALTIVMGLSAIRREKLAEGGEENGGLEKEQKFRLFATGLVSVLYIFIIPIVGYFATTAIFMFALMTILDPTKKVLYLIVVSGSSVILYGVFGVLLRIWVPRGFLF